MEGIDEGVEGAGSEYIVAAALGIGSLAAGPFSLLGVGFAFGGLGVTFKGSWRFWKVKSKYRRLTKIVTRIETSDRMIRMELQRIARCKAAKGW